MPQEVKIFSITTNIGDADIANSIALKRTVNWNKIAVGDGNGQSYIPDPAQRDLRNKRWEGEVSAVVKTDETSNQLRFETTIPAQVGGFTVREIGIYNEAGNLVAISNSPEIQKVSTSSGAALDMFIEFEVIVSNTDVFNFEVDPNIVIATKQDFNNFKAEVKEQLDRIDELAKKIEQYDTLSETLSSLQLTVQTLQQNQKDLEPRVKALETTLDGVAEFLESKI